MLDETKKDKILKASLEEFAAHGFDKASTDNISKAAGVSKGLIFHYYGNKENLYITTINMCIDDIFEEFNNVNYDEFDFIDALVNMMELKYNFYLKNPMHYKLLINSFFNPSKKLQKKLEDRYAELKKIGVSIIVDMINKLPLKKDIETIDIITIIVSITNVVESKYLSYLTDDNDGFEKFYDSAKNEYIRLINIVLNGVII